MSDEIAQAAWDKIEALGGHGVWEPEMCVVSFDSTGICDRDLSIFSDFPYVDTLDLSNNAGISDECIPYLKSLNNLESLILINTSITDAGLAKLAESLPDTEIQSEPLSPDTINPFTGKPIGDNPFG